MSLEAIKSWFNKLNFNDLLIPIIVMIYLISCWLIWWKKIILPNELSSNLFADAIALFFSFFIFQKIVQNNTEKKEIPKQLVAFDEISLLMNRLNSFWSECYNQSISDATPTNFKEFYQVSTFEKIWNNLNLKSYPNVIPKITWESYLIQNAQEWYTHTEKIIDKYGNSIPPEVLYSLHKFSSSIFILSLKQFLRSVNITDQQQGIPRPSLLITRCCLPDEADMVAINHLIDWLNKEQKRLIKYDARLRPLSVLQSRDINSQPPSQMSEIEKSQQILNYRQWQQKQTSK